MPNGYVLVAADPPWAFDNKATRASANKHYSTMMTDEVIALGEHLVPLLAESAILFLWATPTALVDGSATRVARAWSFEPKQIFVWTKTTHDGSRTKIGLGNYFRAACEPAILAVRGRAASTLIGDRSIPNVLAAPNGNHSEKPESVYDLLDRLVPLDRGPRLELFARRLRPGWTCLGDELKNGGE